MRIEVDWLFFAQDDYATDSRYRTKRIVNMKGDKTGDAIVRRTLSTSLDFHGGKSPNDSGPKHRFFLENAIRFVNPDYTDGEVCLTVTCCRRRSIAEQFRDLMERSLLHVRSSLEPKAYDIDRDFSTLRFVEIQARQSSRAPLS